MEQTRHTDSEHGDKPVLLLVDDDPLIIDALSLILGQDYMVYTAESRNQVKKLMQDLTPAPSLALIDLGLPPSPHEPGEGFQLITELIGLNPNMKILVLSGQGEKSNIKHAMTLGAVDFIPKPCDIPLLQTRLVHQTMMLEAEHEKGVGELSGDSLIGQSEEIQTLQALIRQFADTPYPVLILGESGSGKELVAKYLHERSSRARAPFVTLNCAAFTPELLESQMFGHIKGAYTGATQNRAGFFEEADEGSLFLDEVGDLPLGLQSKLLRVLENGEYYRLGELQPRISHTRIIAATNRDLKEEVQSGNFRKDLYHRLSVLTIHVPPLRDRDQDCMILLEHFRGVYASNSAPFILDADASRALQNYAFPGNVRELRNICIRLCAKYPGKNVGVEALMEELETAIPTPAVDPQDLGAVERELAQKDFRLDETINQWERRYITAALKLSGGNLSKAARILGINRTTLYSRVQRLSIQLEDN